MKTIVLKPSAAQTASATGDAFSVVEDASPFTSATFLLDVTAAATETADTLDVYIDFSADNVTWINAVHFTQVLGDGGAKREIAKITNGELNDPDAVLSVASDAAAAVVRNTGVMPYVRYRSAITDSATDNASFTYSVTAQFN